MTRFNTNGLLVPLLRKVTFYFSSLAVVLGLIVLSFLILFFGGIGMAYVVAKYSSLLWGFLSVCVLYIILFLLLIWRGKKWLGSFLFNKALRLLKK